MRAAAEIIRSKRASHRLAPTTSGMIIPDSFISRSWSRSAKRDLRCLIALCLLALSSTAFAQPREINTGASDGDRDGVVSGRLDDDNPRDVFTVEGLRGEVIRFELVATDGDLDPVLSVFDNRGGLTLHRDDSAAGLGALHDLTMEKTGRYFVVVARFGYGLGSTAGAYELRMTRKGVLSEDGSNLRYNDSVIGAISDTNAEVFYTFQAEQGDILTISMSRSSGTLDPYLQVVDSDRFEIASNDDYSRDTRNARIEGLIIERSGAYIIVATRYDDSAGSFVLSIEEAANSGMGSSRLAPLPLAYGESRSGTLSHAQYERFYSFTAETGDLITIGMARGASGDLDSYLILADAAFTPIQEDDDSGEEFQDALISDYRIPAAGLYHIIATRFDGGRGTTGGDYRLSLDILDDPFVETPVDAVSLKYGTSVTGKISADNEDDLYAFYGRRGEVISISMTRVDGNLDAYLELLNAAQEAVTRNDDSGGSQNSLIDNFSIPATGMYYIRARRYAGTDGNPNTAGSYVLVLAERAG